MSYQANIQLLRALGQALGDNASAHVLHASDEKPGIAEQVTRLVVCDFAASCLQAADQLERDHKDLAEKLAGAPKSL